LVVLTTEAILNITNYSLLCTVLRVTGDVKNYEEEWRGGTPRPGFKSPRMATMRRSRKYSSNIFLAKGDGK
jgi:hypothetical protein